MFLPNQYLTQCFNDIKKQDQIKIYILQFYTWFIYRLYDRIVYVVYFTQMPFYPIGKEVIFAHIW